MSPRATIAELLVFLLVWGLILSFLPGCDTKAQTPVASNPTPAGNVAKKPPARQPAVPSSGESDLPKFAGGEDAAETDPVENERSPVVTAEASTNRFRPTRAVSESAIEAAGLHRLAGKHLTLYTDLPLDDEIKALPEVFDLAFAQWCAYFQLDPAKFAQWQMRGTLIGDKAKFAGTGLLPEELPPFRNGFARAGELWLYEQPSAYYRRHLLLHEGTHGFMDMLLGGSGPAWYMEGMAELLATHTWKNGELTLNVMPANKEDFEMLGRIKIVQQGTAAAGQPKPLTEILNYNNRAHLENEPYGWCWALAAFLERHPQYQARFRELHAQANDPQFNAKFVQAYSADCRQLNAEWQLFASTLEHGHDVVATAIDFQPGVPIASDEIFEVPISAERGWQSSGMQLLPGQKYRITATGRYQVAITTEPWISEPNGVTIEYYRGRPLGMLLAAVVDLDAANWEQLVSPVAIGLSGKITSEHGGTLYLQANDSAAERADNSGQLQVEIAAE